MKKKNLLLTFLIAATFLLGGGVMAQETITIGSGISSTSNFPIMASKNYSYTQQLYSADEIGGSGTITRIAFFAAKETTRNLDIYMVNTATSSFNSGSNNDFIAVSDADKVFSGEVSFTNEDWTTVTLSKSFLYDGSYLALVVNDKTGSSVSDGVKFRYFNSIWNDTNYISVYATNDDNSFDPTSPGKGTGSYRTRCQIQLAIAYTYAKPTGLVVNSITDQTASISWTNPTPPFGTTLNGFQYRKTNSGSYSGDPISTANPCELSGLTSYTTYAFQVRAIYTDNSKDTHYSPWAEVPFLTSCTVPTTTWGFEGSNDMPLGWEITAFYNTGSTTYPKIYNSSSYSHNSSRSIQFYYTNTNEEIIQMPAINETLNGKTLSFYAKNDGGYNTTYSIIIGYYNEYNVFVAPEGSIITITNSAYDNDNDQIGYYKYDITGWPNDIRKIAIKGYTTYSNSRYIYLDDVKIDYTTSCSPVSSPTVGTVNYNSAQLSWTAGGSESNWKLQYRASGAGSWTTVNVSSANLVAGIYTLDGLSENTTYEWQVAAWCDTSDNDNISTYVAGEDFSTPVQFPMPTSLAANNISTNSADITWTAGSTETAWQLYYSPYDYANPGSASPEDLINVSTTPAYTMTGLTGNTTYYVYVRANYGEDHYSSWTDAMSFRTTVLLPYSYDFTDESEMNSWTMYNCHPTQTGRTGSESNYYFHIMSSGTYNPQYLITPLFENNSNALLVSFDYKLSSGTNAPYPTLSVGYSTTNKEIESFSWPECASVEVNSTTYQKFVYIFQVEGIKYITVKYNRNGSPLNTDIDNISFTPIDKVYTGDSDEWDYLLDWTPAGLPELTDDMYVNDAITIPSNCRALANSITLGPNGSLTIEDGGQLICNKSVDATVKKSITGYGAKAGENDGWSFIASPISTNIAPSTVENMTEGAYDLYRFREGILLGWENYKNNEASHYHFSLENGRGYLYANAAGKELSFAGFITPSSPDVNVNLSYTTEADPKYVGWNLVGNPFTADAYINRSYYRMVEQDGHVVIDPETSSSGAIRPCEGVMVRAESTEQSVTFTTTAPAQSNQANGNLQMVLAQNVATRGESAVQTLDKAIVSFNEGSQLGKFYFGTQDANLYIPQDNEEYAIVSSSAQGEMPVNFKAHRDGQYTLTVNPQEVEMGYLHLIDNVAGKDIDLLATPSYTFNAKADDYESRFRLVFSANMVNADLNDDFAFFSNGQLVIANEGEAIFQVIDVTGRVVATESVNGTCSKAVNVKAGVYVLRLINGTNVKTQKIIVK